MKPRRATLACTTAAIITLAAVYPSQAADLVTVEAESGTLGADFGTTVAGGVTNITLSPTGGGDTPGSADRLTTYTVDFPTSGVYQLYARIRVGPDNYDDDSFFCATGFGERSPAIPSDWILVNGLAGAGFAASNDVVSGSGTAGWQVWKWLNISAFAGPGSLPVDEESLQRTYAIAGREDGLYIDKFVFGTAGTPFTVAELDRGIPSDRIPVYSTRTFDGAAGMAIHRFDETHEGMNRDGANPATGLAILDGGLCGTTLNGGENGSGTAFHMSLDGTTFTTIMALTSGTPGGYPHGDPVLTGDRFFSTATGGGLHGVGSVFSGQTNGRVSVIHDFASVSPHTAANVGGASPCGPMAQSGNMLYGTTTAGGAHANGTIFAVSTNGSSFSVLLDFDLLDSNSGTNLGGALPYGGLMLDGDTLYGTTSAGGAGGAGVVFSIHTDGTGCSVLHNFGPLDVLTATNADGAFPTSCLALSDGMLYGTTPVGGSHGEGTVFALGTNGAGFSVLHAFSATDPLSGSNSDGASPSAGLLLSGNVLYGTASAGGAGAAGTVFSLSPAGSDFSTIYSFESVADSGTNTLGAYPVARLARSGNALYGTAFGGGPGGAGVVFNSQLPTHTVIADAASGSLDAGVRAAPDSTNALQAVDDLATSNMAWQNLPTHVADGESMCHWITAWGCGPQLTESRNVPPVYLSHNTLRQYVHTTQEGSLVRVRFSNAYGTAPVPINAAHMALAAGAGSAGNGEIDPATDTPLTFRGAPATVIPPGEALYSDPVHFTLMATTEVAVSTFFGNVSETVINGHPGARVNSFIATGNKIANANLPGSAATRHWYNLTGIEVLAEPSSHTVVTFGDSITDGYGTFDGNNRWPDFFARRLSTNATTAGVSVANMGIGGGGIGGGLGPAGVDRFDRDVLNQNGVKWVILFIGVNDIGGSQNAPTLIDAYTEFADKAHARNILVYGATITPIGGSGYDSAEHRATRQTVNVWIRTNTLFDAVIDLDAAIRDPSNPEYILSAYNNDNLHPNIAGYEALADAIDVTLFTPAPGPHE